MNEFADTVTDFVDTMFLENPLPALKTPQSPRPARVENIISMPRAAAQDVWLRSRRTRQASRDGSLRGLAAEVLGEERARRWLSHCDPLEAPLLSSLLMRRARSSQPINFSEAAAAVWM